MKICSQRNKFILLLYINDSLRHSGTTKCRCQENKLNNQGLRLTAFVINHIVVSQPFGRWLVLAKAKIMALLYIYADLEISHTYILYIFINFHTYLHVCSHISRYVSTHHTYMHLCLTFIFSINKRLRIKKPLYKKSFQTLRIATKKKVLTCKTYMITTCLKHNSIQERHI